MVLHFKLQLEENGLICNSNLQAAFSSQVISSSHTQLACKKIFQLILCGLIIYHLKIICFRLESIQILAKSFKSYTHHSKYSHGSSQNYFF